MNCKCSDCPARVFYIADFDPAGHGMPVSVLATPHWRKDRHGQPRYLYPIYPTQDPSTLPFDLDQVRPKVRIRNRPTCFQFTPSPFATAMSSMIHLLM
jgi:hypothetical protein